MSLAISMTPSLSARSKEIAPFLRNLRRILDHEHASIVRWTPDGLAFEIHDLTQMTEYVLPKYFKHRKYTSFQRQLNYFHFRKWTKSRSTVCTFSNPYFVRDDPDLAWHICRKKSTVSHSPTQKKASTSAESLSIKVPSSEPIMNNTVLLSFPSPNDVMSLASFMPRQSVWGFPVDHFDPTDPEPTCDDHSLDWVDALYPSLLDMEVLDAGIHPVNIQL